MIGSDIPPGDDRKSGFFWWEKEVFDHNKKIQEGLSKQYHYMRTAEMPKARFSDILRFLRMCREKPEIWNEFVALQQRIESGETSDDNLDNGYDESYKRIGSAVGDFCNWLFIAEDLPGPQYPFSLGPALLLMAVKGKLDLYNDDAVRAEYSSYPLARNDVDFEV